MSTEFWNGILLANINLKTEKDMGNQVQMNSKNLKCVEGKQDQVDQRAQDLVQW
jgi:hypothetical protein